MVSESWELICVLNCVDAPRFTWKYSDFVKFSSYATLMAFEGGELEIQGMQAQIEQLGRQRPAKFSTGWIEIGFCFSLLASMVMAVYTQSS